MKIFISWSGTRSHQVAELLNTWIQCVLQAVDPWLSSKDIDRGSLWFSEINNQLANTQNGIICLTKGNKDKPWILFESGALAKGLASNRVFTFLIDLKPSDVRDPLAQFNHTLPTKDSIYQLIRSINNGLGDNRLRENILSNVFETYWPQFNKEFKNIIKNTPEEEIKESRPEEDIMNDILYSVRNIDKRLRNVENEKYRSNDFTDSSLNIPIEELNFSVRATKYLHDNGISKLNDIGQMSYGSVKEIFGKNKGTLKEVIKNLNSIGYNWEALNEIIDEEKKG